MKLFPIIQTDYMFSPDETKQFPKPEAQADSMDIDTMEKMARYEVFLDRKLERILSMLLKLQALRRERERVEKVTK